MRKIKEEFTLIFIYETAIWMAARVSNMKIIKILLENGADPEIADNSGKKPIQFLSPDNQKLFNSYIQ